MSGPSHLPVAQRMDQISGPSVYDDIAPGSWWRHTGSFQRMADRDAPDHGLIFLMGEVRVIDGEIHTVVFHEHPNFGSSTFMVLLDDLMVNFVHQADGEKLRAIELDALMDAISGITGQLSQPPSDDDLIKALPAPAAVPEAADVNQGSQEPTGQRASVPSFLLPNGGIDAAQLRIELAITVMNARKNWVEALTLDMKSKMGLVARFQSEKVNLSLAGISEQRKKAESLLANVQTMRLWLGDDQEFHTIKTGEGPAADAPLHFLQRMLYLDEEIFTHKMMDGLNGDNWPDIKDMLAQNQDLVRRMMPYERSVVITKVRRKTREYKTPFSMSNLFERLDDDASDKQIQILIRNGDQVYLVAADEVTSEAKRLFPSKAEIDAIFTERNNWNRDGSSTRTITAHDIEYSAKRADHDSRALFYKRVLLIVWGLAEREQIFGNFIGTGTNWLERSVHDDAFVFVHDEENVLPDGRQSVQSYIDENRAKSTSGSRVIVDWDRMISPENARQLYGTPSKDGYVHREASPKKTFEVAFAERRGRDLTVKCEVSKYSYGKHDDRVFNSPVNLLWHETYGGKTSRSFAKGFLCLDHVEIEDLDYYFESRLHREHYLSYLHLFDRARSILIEERDACKPAMDFLTVGNAVPVDLARRALKLWRTGHKSVIPDVVENGDAIVKLAIMLAGEVPEPDGDVVSIALTAKGALEIQRLVHIEIFGRSLPFAKTDVYTMTTRSGWKLKSTRMGDVEIVAGIGRERLYENMPAAVLAMQSEVPDILLSYAAVSRMAAFADDSTTDNPGGMSQIAWIKDFIADPGAFGPGEMIRRCLQWSIANSKKTVTTPHIKTTIGYACFADKGRHDIYKFVLFLNPVEHMKAKGFDEEVAFFAKNIYGNPERGVLRILAESKSYIATGVSIYPCHEVSHVTGDQLEGVVTFGEKMYHGTDLPAKDPSHTPFYSPSFDPESLQELLIRVRFGLGMYREPKEETEMLSRYENCSFSFLDGGLEIIEEMTRLKILEIDGPAQEISSP